MGTETTERRCKSCHKLLLDEKIPFCRRCVLEGRNKAVHITEIVGGLATAAVGTIALLNNNDHNANSNNEDSPA